MLIEYLNETYLNITFAYVFKPDFEMTYQNSFNLLLFMFLCLQFCCLKRSLIINTIRNQISLELLKLLMYKTGIPDTLDSINSHLKLTKHFDSFHSVLKAP